MPRKEKVEIVNQIADILQKNSIVIATDYRGLTVDQINVLRRQLQAKNVKYQVVKNTLARFAAEKTGKQNLDTLLTGPTALAFSFDSITDPAQALVEYQRSSKSPLDIKGALLDEQILSAEQVIALSRLPSKEVLIAKLLATMQSPIMALLNILNSNMQAFIRVLQARTQQIEGG